MLKLYDSLEKCRALIALMESEDKLLHKIIERKYPGFIAEFKFNVTKLGHDYNALQEIVKKRGRTCTQPFLHSDWSMKLRAISDLQRDVLDVLDDRSKTSTKVVNSSAYKKLESVLCKKVKEYADMSPNDFNRCLDELLATLPDEDFDDGPDVTVSSSNVKFPSQVQSDLYPLSHGITHFATTPELNLPSLPLPVTTRRRASTSDIIIMQDLITIV
ncbi:hypothetical protein CERSUDRAFT_97638 [Gelatoporia subvermispora B]|uniref:Uncharacterized protein n=1 Tax=Ceriporiopsis subvermispora (strain B) TaxID=914234 RepID=M2QBL4_CERS8|nr:hypothetical protein CERSUDRAFT_97638 [Gelatoporia subvermispora B]